MNIAYLLLSFGLLIIAMTFHEFAHAWVANKLGDPTAKYSGRLTLNPIAHIDPIWTILLPFLLFVTTQGRFIFGAAKPVPINYWALNNPKKDIIWVGASGPAANLLAGFLFSLLLRFIPAQTVLSLLVENLIVINVVLGIFNLIPIPPLDGSRIMMGLLPKEAASHYARIEPYGFIIIMVLIWMGFLSAIVWPIVASVLHLFGV
jgi:Zn-dependent protease